MVYFALCRLDKLLSRRSGRKHKKDAKKDDEIIPDADQDDLYVERKRLENMELRFYISYHVVVLLADSVSVQMCLFTVLGCMFLF